MEIYTVDMKDEIKEISKKVIFQSKRNIDTVEIKYFWDSHGTLTPFTNDEGKKSKTLHNVDFRVERITQELYMEHVPVQTFEQDVVYINGVRQNWGVHNFSGTYAKLRVKAVVGWG